tara:strand:- start:373 stop:600 length:228 start_codon:yes stop_codon:yes gene_type:complete
MYKNIFHNNKHKAEDLVVKNIHTTHNVKHKINVDINTLLNRVKIDKLFERKQKFIFFSFGFLLLNFMGIFVFIIR